MAYFGRLALFFFMGVISILTALLVIGIAEYLPQALFALNFRGVLETSTNLIATMLSVGALTVFFGLGYSWLLERFVPAPFVKCLIISALLLATVPICVFAFRGPGFDTLFLPIFALVDLGIAMVALITLRRKKPSERFWLTIGAGLALITGAMFCVFEVIPKANSALSLLSFPAEENFDLRAEWTSTFLSERPQVDQFLKAKLVSEIKASQSIAFSSGQLHWIDHDWMDGPRFAVEIEDASGHKQVVCSYPMTNKKKCGYLNLD